MKFIPFIFVVFHFGFSKQAPVVSPAKAHVKKVNQNWVKYTSKLKHLVDLNFTIGYHHKEGRTVIASAMDRIAQEEGFTVTHFTGGADGSKKGEIPEFGLKDLEKCQVIIANNVSTFGDPKLGTDRQQAIQTAIEKNGIGYLGIHGAGDNTQSGWPWFSNTLHPVVYKGHDARTPGPIYKHPANQKHLMLDGILEADIEKAAMPNEIDANGTALTADDVPFRRIRSEWYKFGRDITRDPKYADKVTILLKYDGNDVGGELPKAFVRAGGNIYSYLYQVGAGRTSYLPAGHDNMELYSTDPKDFSFNAGTGDLDRYLKNTFYYLAGYTPSPCDNSCNGLAIADTNDILTGNLYEDASWVRRRRWAVPGIALLGGRVTVAPNHEIEILDISGRRIFSRRSAEKKEYDLSEYDEGLYLVRIKSADLNVDKMIFIR